MRTTNRSLAMGIHTLQSSFVLAALLMPDSGGPFRDQVTPGQVQWHPNFEAACEAAESSGKPILLFELFGRLDEERC